MARSTAGGIEQPTINRDPEARPHATKWLEPISLGGRENSNSRRSNERRFSHFLASECVIALQPDDNRAKLVIEADLDAASRSIERVGRRQKRRSGRPQLGLGSGP